VEVTAIAPVDMSRGEKGRNKMKEKCKEEREATGKEKKMRAGNREWSIFRVHADISRDAFLRVI